MREPERRSFRRSSAAFRLLGFQGRVQSAGTTTRSGERFVSPRKDYTRRWLLNASGSAMLSSTRRGSRRRWHRPRLPPRSWTRTKSGGASKSPKVSANTTILANYIAATLDRDLPADVISGTKLHILDTFAAMLSGSRLAAGKFATRYVDSLGGKPQSTVVGSNS